MNYNNERYALLENGEIEPLYYYGDDGKPNPYEPRDFYQQGKEWYLDHDELEGTCFVRCHHKIIAFANEEKELMK